MVYVRLDQDWTDAEGDQHSAGDMVDVDAATLAQLQADGVVGEPVDPAGGGWVGPSGGAGTTGGGWVGPSGDSET